MAEDRVIFESENGKATDDCPFGIKLEAVDIVAFLADMAREIKRLRAERQWNFNMGEAPRDGTRILILLADNSQRAAYWDKEMIYKWDEETEHSWFEGAWTDEAVRSWGNEETETYQPIAFMPLPAAPAQPTATDGGTER